MKITRPYEVLIRYERRADSTDDLRISGHTKTLTEFLGDPDPETGVYPVESAKEGDAVELTMGGEALAEVLGSVSETLTRDVGRLNKRVDELETAGAELQQAHESLLAEHAAALDELQRLRAELEISLSLPNSADE